MLCEEFTINNSNFLPLWVFERRLNDILHFNDLVLREIEPPFFSFLDPWCLRFSSASRQQAISGFLGPLEDAIDDVGVSPGEEELHWESQLAKDAFHLVDEVLVV